MGPRFTCRLVDLARLDEVPFILFFCVWVQIPKQRVHANGFLLKLFRLGLFEVRVRTTGCAFFIGSLTPEFLPRFRYSFWPRSLAQKVYHFDLIEKFAFAVAALPFLEPGIKAPRKFCG